MARRQADTPWTVAMWHCEGGKQAKDQGKKSKGEETKEGQDVLVNLCSFRKNTGSA